MIKNIFEAIYENVGRAATSLMMIFIIIGVIVITIPDVRIAVIGHVEDAISRTTSDEFIDGSRTSIGSFDETSDGRDSFHWANGTVSIVEVDGERYIQLSEDFDSGPLPDGYVYVSASRDINNNVDFDSTVQIEIGKLKKGSGASYYKIPTDVVVNSVTILCKKFHVFISSADMVATYFDSTMSKQVYDAIQNHKDRN